MMYSYNHNHHHIVYILQYERKEENIEFELTTLLICKMNRENEEKKRKHVKL